MGQWQQTAAGTSSQPVIGLQGAPAEPARGLGVGLTPGLQGDWAQGGVRGQVAEPC